MNDDLNKLLIPTDNYPEKHALHDHSIKKGNVNVYFKNIKSKLIEHIGRYDVILGCVAWLTDFEIIDALAKKHAAIIVQKEDFLRPDFNEKGDSDWRKRLQYAYSKLKFGYCRQNFANLLNDMSFASDGAMEAVRCVGNYNRDKKSAFPRMHNKFLVFCKVEREKILDNFFEDVVKPCAVWTGSFNFTNNAGLSFENALFIDDIDIATAYYNEFGQIAALSEQLNWQSVWVEPEWRIGS